MARKKMPLDDTPMQHEQANPLQLQGDLRLLTEQKHQMGTNAVLEALSKIQTAVTDIAARQRRYLSTTRRLGTPQSFGNLTGRYCSD